MNHYASAADASQNADQEPPGAGLICPSDSGVNCSAWQSHARAHALSSDCHDIMIIAATVAVPLHGKIL